MGPLAMFGAWRASHPSRRFLSEADSPALRGDPLTPCCPNRIILIRSPCLATTTCDLVGWLGVRFGLL